MCQFLAFFKIYWIFASPLSEGSMTKFSFSSFSAKVGSQSPGKEFESRIWQIVETGATTLPFHWIWMFLTWGCIIDQRAMWSRKLTQKAQYLSSFKIYIWKVYWSTLKKSVSWICTMISLMLQVITDSEGRLVEFDLPGVETEVWKGLRLGNPP